jgi:hypothetical protein
MHMAYQSTMCQGCHRGFSRITSAPFNWRGISTAPQASETSDFYVSLDSGSLASSTQDSTFNVPCAAVSYSLPTIFRFDECRIKSGLTSQHHKSPLYINLGIIRPPRHIRPVLPFCTSFTHTRQHSSLSAKQSYCAIQLV